MHRSVFNWREMKRSFTQIGVPPITRITITISIITIIIIQPYFAEIPEYFKEASQSP